MQIKCEYCGGFLNDCDEMCPHCGAVNSNLKRQSNETPRTIEELKGWYVSHHLPPEKVTRFFIGTDFKGAKAFGIYKDESTGNIVVYKNKADGSRAIRYEGKDEAYAVNELYLKLKETVAMQKANNASRKNTNRGGRRPSKQSFGINCIVFATVAFILVVSILVSCFGQNSGYYRYNNDQYYYLNNAWYLYNGSDWVETSVDSELSNNYDDYYESSGYDSSYGTTKFEDTSYYQDWSSSSWDSDSDWSSSDSWDSGSSDWDSDW